MTIPRHTLLLAAPLLVGLTACHAHFDGYGSGSQTLYVGEVEINDYEWQAQHIGWVGGGDLVIIEGSITDDGWDPRDGYALHADHPILVEVVLDAHLPGVDLDWCVWDPYVGDYVYCAESEFDPETGTFIVIPPGEEFHVVVSSYHGSSSYTLELFISDYYPLEVGEVGAGALPVAAEAAPEGAALDAAEAPHVRNEEDATAPRGDADRTYGRDLTWDAPTPDDPIFAGPLFTFDVRD